MQTERKLALFMDFENIAIGIEDAKYGRFDLDLVQKRLVDIGKILFKRAYANWDRYTKYRRVFHQSSIQLFDIPKSTKSGKNAADIQMVIDAMELCYSKDHIDVFVLASGDSDFSPLVSKLRENDKYVIGFGVKNSVSPLLVSNCDEFIYYEDVIAKPFVRAGRKSLNLTPKKQELFDLLMESIMALNRNDYDVIWGSMVKQTMKRKNPSFNEHYYGYNLFSEVLRDAAKNGLIEVEKDQRSGSLIVSNIKE
ncbi:MAG: NYN domain-containing protein [Planctomycetota bacterium]